MEAMVAGNFKACLMTSDVDRTRGVDLDVAIYMGLSSEDVKNAGGARNLLEALWPMFSALKDPRRQTAVVNLDGAPTLAHN